MKKLLLILVFVMSATLNCLAQDPSFSQFFASPLTLNPALTAKFDGVVRASVNYRDQWPAISKAYITATASVDMGILRSKLAETDTWGIGILAMTDKTANGILNSNYFCFSTAYHKALDENGHHQLGIGFQGTYGSKTLDGTKLNFEDELDQLGGWTNPTSEPINDRSISVSYFDLNAGILYNGSTDGISNYYFGAAVYHVNRPKQSFSGDGFYTLYPRVTLHGGGSFPVADNASIQLSGLQSFQAGAHNTVLGGNVMLTVNNDENIPTNVYLGSWYRFSDALIPYVGFEFGEFLVGATYDVNVSSLKSASQSRGGIELSLIYVKRRGDGSKKIPCPRF